MIGKVKPLKYYWKGAIYYTVMAACNVYYWVLSQTPWRQAQVLLAFKKYVDSSWFTDRLGIMGKERFQYWKLLLWTISRRPQLFPLAITFAIYGHHFRKICERL